MDSQWAKSLIHFYLDSFFPLFYCTPFLISTLFLHYVLASAAPNLSPLVTSCPSMSFSTSFPYIIPPTAATVVATLTVG